MLDYQIVEAMVDISNAILASMLVPYDVLCVIFIILQIRKSHYLHFVPLVPPKIERHRDRQIVTELLQIAAV